MQKIYKYQLQVTDTQEIKMPVGSEMLHIEEQHGALCLWALIDPEADLEMREFRIHGTGHDIKSLEGFQFLGSALMRSGMLVFHIFIKQQ